MYKQASRMQLRISTNKGWLSVEQLWQLNQSDIAAALKSVKKLIKKTEDDDLGFLTDATVTQADAENELRFNILKDVYLSKKEEADAARTAAKKKENNQRIMQLIAQKQEQALGEKSIEELMAMLED